MLTSPQIHDFHKKCFFLHITPKSINSGLKCTNLTQNLFESVLKTFLAFVLGIYYSKKVNKKSLKGPINPGEHLLAFGTQKPENFNDKNRIYLAFWCVFKDIEHYFHEFVCFKKKILLSLSVSHDFKIP